MEQQLGGCTLSGGHSLHSEIAQGAHCTIYMHSFTMRACRLRERAADHKRTCFRTRTNRIGSSWLLFKTFLEKKRLFRVGGSLTTPNEFRKDFLEGDIKRLLLVGGCSTNRQFFWKGHWRLLLVGGKLAPLVLPPLLLRSGSSPCTGITSSSCSPSHLGMWMV